MIDVVTYYSVIFINNENEIIALKEAELKK